MASDINPQSEGDTLEQQPELPNDLVQVEPIPSTVDEAGGNEGGGGAESPEVAAAGASQPARTQKGSFGRAKSSNRLPVPEEAEGDQTPSGKPSVVDEILKGQEDPRQGGETASPLPEASKSAEGLFSGISDVPGSLHMVAGRGNAQTVEFLLRQGANPHEVDITGQTPLQIAEKKGHKEVARVLREAMGLPMPPPEEETPEPAQVMEPAEAQEQAEVQEMLDEDLGAPMPIMEDIEMTEEVHQATLFPSSRQSTQQSYQGGMQKNKSMASNASSPSFDFKELKKKTEFASTMNSPGVKQGKVLLTNVSSYKRAPCFSMRGRDGGTFVRSSSVPAPGTYDMPQKDRFKSAAKFSFGGESRFGQVGPGSPTKRSPGPGQYNPRDPVVEVSPKVGFGSGMRLRGALIAQSNPGPGAYEARTTIGLGLACTAKGRIPVTYIPNKSSPGPGAYNPSAQTILPGQPKCGFGTTRREDKSHLSAKFAPGPGSYELQNFRSTGSEAPKFSATSRRRVHDLDSYLTPGPGSYNANMTCFG